jgi:hypothetical protein
LQRFGAEHIFGESMKNIRERLPLALVRRAAAGRIALADPEADPVRKADDMSAC